MGDRLVYVFCCTMSGDSHFVSIMIITEDTVKPRFTANPNNRGNFPPNKMEAELLTITYITWKIKNPINRKPRFDAVIPFPKTPPLLLRFHCT